MVASAEYMANLMLEKRNDGHFGSYWIVSSFKVATSSFIKSQRLNCQVIRSLKLLLMKDQTSKTILIGFGILKNAPNCEKRYKYDVGV